VTARVGIEKLRFYPGSLSLDMELLCAARAHDLADVRDTLMVDRRSVNPPWEDAVTMAVNAALPMLTDEDKASIELVIVGSESSVDQEKPLSSWVHGYLGIQPHCRNFEIKHACYSGTAGLQLAASWIASGLSPRGKALVINTDQSVMALGAPWEFVCGAGAVAMVVSREPAFLELELGRSGVYAHEVTDVIRPTGRIETGNSETSLFSYLEALEESYARYVERVGTVDFDSFFKKNVYHVPFGGMGFRAHKTLLQASGATLSREQLREHFERKTAASLRYTREVGSIYGSSTFVAALGLVDGSDDLAAGDRLGIFAYGSGSCAEFYSALVGQNARDVAKRAGVRGLLDARHVLTMQEYEEIERERDAGIGVADFTPRRDRANHWYERHYAGRGALVLEKVEGYFRHYGWS
jgi:hydroxymethylglutaryl-CoA synthase